MLFNTNTILLCKVLKDQLLHLSWVLFWFQVSFELKINLEKSDLIPVNRLDNVEVLATELGCQIDSLPSTYLGLPSRVWHKPVAI